MPKNLWGELPSGDDVRPPLSILKQQAAVLGELTNGVLYGDVSVSREGIFFTLELRIVAPALDGYEYSVLQVHHNLRMYPLKIMTDRVRRTQSGIECDNEAEFEAALAKILASKSLHSVIASLIAQSRAV